MKRSFNKESALYKTPDNLFHIIRYGCFYIRADQFEMYCKLIKSLKGLMARVLGYGNPDKIESDLCDHPEAVDHIYCLRTVPKD